MVFSLSLRVWICSWCYTGPTVWQPFKEASGRASYVNMSPTLSTHWLSDVEFFINFSYCLISKTGKSHALDGLLIRSRNTVCKTPHITQCSVNGGCCCYCVSDCDWHVHWGERVHFKMEWQSSLWPSSIRTIHEVIAKLPIFFFKPSVYLRPFG